MKKKILIVDDDPAVRRIMTYLLDQHFHVVTKNNGLEALSFLQQGKMVDLIITDLEMPEMEGEELILMFSKDSSLSHIPVIIVSSKLNFRIGRLRTCHQLRAVLPKPVNAQDLYGKVGEILGQTIQ